GLVGVADQVLVHVAAGQEAGLLPHPEAGAATAAKSGLIDVGEHILGGHLDRLAQRLIAAAALVDLERVQAGLVDSLEQKLHSCSSSGPNFDAPSATPGSAHLR